MKDALENVIILYMLEESEWCKPVVYLYRHKPGDPWELGVAEYTRRDYVIDGTQS